jgi:hypothetical protein
MSTITAIFDTRLSAESAISQLESLGVTPSQISLLMTDETRGSHFKIKEGDKSDEGAATGAGIGGLIGAVAGTVLSAGVLVIPGLNLVVAGTLVSALAGLGTGAVAGGVVGGLIGAGIPEHEAKHYEKAISSGSILVAVEADDKDQKKAIERIFQEYNEKRSAA